MSRRYKFNSKICIYESLKYNRTRSTGQCRLQLIKDKSVIIINNFGVKLKSLLLVIEIWFRNSSLLKKQLKKK